MNYFVSTSYEYIVYSLSWFPSEPDASLILLQKRRVLILQLQQLEEKEVSSKNETGRVVSLFCFMCISSSFYSSSQSVCEKSILFYLFVKVVPDLEWEEDRFFLFSDMFVVRGKIYYFSRRNEFVMCESTIANSFQWLCFG